MALTQQKLNLLIVLFCLAFTLKAQDSSRVYKISTQYFTSKQVDRNENWQHVDTSLNRIEIFQPVFKNYILFQDLGNCGSAARPLLFDVNRETGFGYAQNPFGIYTKNAEDAQYINTKTPYTDLFYAQGAQNLLVLKAKHSQNINPRWNVGVDYQRITSQGFIQRSYTSHYNVQFFTSYQSKLKKYTLLANVTWNKGLLEESGGIKNDSLFETLSGGNKTVSPRLSGAQTRYKSSAAYIKQYWNFGSGSYQYKDEDTIYDFKAHSHLAYTFKAEQINYIFENTGNIDTTLLPNQYYDIGQKTYDSAHYSTIENKLAYAWFNSRQDQLKDSTRKYFNVELSHSFINVGQIAFSRYYQNIIANFALENINLKNNSLSYSAAASYAISGFNGGDFKAQALMRFRLRKIDITATALTQLYRPDYTYLLFKSNQFIWDNPFAKISVTKIGGKMSTRNWRHNATIEFNNFAVQNWVYSGLDATPKQNNDIAIIQTLTLSKTFQAWKFRFEHELIAQHSYNDMIRLPAFGGMARYYFESYMFKKLRFQLGFSVFYNTAYYGNNYNSATRMFYLQNTTSIGNYPVIDPFFNAEIKRVSFFVKYEHVNQDWFANSFYYTPHYPLTLRSLRFGVRWRFYN